MGCSFAYLPLSGEDDSSSFNSNLKAIVRIYKILIIPAFKSNLAVICRWFDALRSGVSSIPTYNLMDDNAKKTIADLKPLLMPRPVHLSGVPGETMARLYLQWDWISAMHPSRKLEEWEEKVIEMLQEGESLMYSEFYGIRSKSTLLYQDVLKKWTCLMGRFKEVPESGKTIEEMKSDVTEFGDMFDAYHYKFTFFETKFMRLTLTLEVDD